LTEFGHSFESKRGVYYLVSPEIIVGPFDWRHGKIASDRRRFELAHDYVILYGRNETLAGRLGLAAENMEVIRNRFPGWFSKHQADSISAGGEVTIGNLAQTANALCGLEVTYGPNAAALTLVTSGLRVSAKQLCVGFGIAAAVGGYRVVPTKRGLELRQEFDVKQGAAIEGGHAEGQSHSSGPSLQTS
jgi:hypothetical protein